jgi:ATP-dependent DNA ligase
VASTTFPIDPPIEPMLAKLSASLPAGAFLYEPKWDGFRAIVYRGKGDVYIQSRDLRPLDRYFPELHDMLLTALPDRCVVDGEIVIASKRGLDFDALQMRLHPAASRVAKLAAETPSSFVAFDVLAAAGKDVRGKVQSERRALLEKLFQDISRAPASSSGPASAGSRVTSSVHLTPMTRDLKVATDWLARFEGAGLDGVIAKPEDGVYEPGKRAMVKVKHARTAECVVAGFRWHKDGKDERVGSLLLGLYDRKGHLHHVGVTSAFSMATRKELVKELAPLRKNAMKDHPWRDWAGPVGRVPPGGPADASMTRMPGGQSRWSAGKDLSWEPLRPERVCEVKYDHMQGDRFRHAAIFLRWRPDKPPEDCTYDQLEVTTPYELSKVFKSQ